MALPLIAAAAAPVVGGLIGQFASKGDSSAAKSAQKNALKAIQGLTPPQQAELLYQLEEYGYLGDYTPEELLSAGNLGDTELKGVMGDSQLGESQRDALAGLDRIIEGGGMTDAERAQMEQILAETQTTANQNNAGIREEMARRGQGGGNQELLMRMIANQDAANNMNTAQNQVASTAAMRGLDALGQKGQLAKQMYENDLSQKNRTATAQDAINQFNQTNLQNIRNTNNQNANQAAQYNHENRQNIAGQNTDVRNQNKQLGVQATKDAYGYQADKAGMLSGAYSDYAKTRQDSANATKAMWGGIGSGVGSIGAGLLKK